MPDKVEVLLDLYNAHCDWERYHENQRSSVTSILIAVAAGILGIVTFDGHINIIDVPLTSFLVILGCFGALFLQNNMIVLPNTRSAPIKLGKRLTPLFPMPRY